MNEKIKVTVAERTFLLTSSDEESYGQKVAESVDEQMCIRDRGKEDIGMVIGVESMTNAPYVLEKAQMCRIDSYMTARRAASSKKIIR